MFYALLQLYISAFQSAACFNSYHPSPGERSVQPWLHPRTRLWRRSRDCSPSQELRKWKCKSVVAVWSYHWLYWGHSCRHNKQRYTVYSHFSLVPCRHLIITGTFLIPTVGTDSSNTLTCLAVFQWGGEGRNQARGAWEKWKRELFLPRVCHASD